jgi:acetyl esterase/lipase
MRSKLFLKVCLVLLVCLAFTGCSAAPAGTTSAAQSNVPTATQASVLPKGAGAMGGGSFASVAPTYKDLAYAFVSNAQKLDLYLPAGEGPFPVVVMIHGGGFMMGDKSDGAGLAGVDQLLAAGYAVASINYRLSAEATYPAQINDAKAAVRFLRANAAQYKLNPQKFGAWGASAGGNLAALLGTTCGVKELEGADLGNADQSSCVQAVVDWFGPIDFAKMDEQFAGTSCPQTHSAAGSPESNLVGGALASLPEVVKTTNPMNYIDASDAAFLIQHGSADCNIPPIQGKNLADALSAAIGADKVTYTLIDGAGHGGAQFGTAENLKLVVSFLDKYLK